MKKMISILLTLVFTILISQYLSAASPFSKNSLDIVTHVTHINVIADEVIASTVLYLGKNKDSVCEKWVRLATWRPEVLTRGKWEFTITKEYFLRRGELDETSCAVEEYHLHSPSRFVTVEYALISDEGSDRGPIGKPFEANISF